MNESRPYEGNKGCALEFGSEFCGNAITLEQEAYKRGKADGERKMLEVILDMWYQFAYPCEDNESWSDGGLSALESAGSVLVNNGILKYDNGIYTKLPDSERG